MSNKSESCKNASDQQLYDSIRTGSLRHAAARYELNARGKSSLIAKADVDGFREMRKPF